MYVQVRLGAFVSFLDRSVSWRFLDTVIAEILVSDLVSFISY